MATLSSGMSAAASALGTVSAKARKTLEQRGRRPDDPGRWRVVTVYRPTGEVPAGAGLPEPLAAWGNQIEVRVTAAPGDRGSELAARLRDPAGVQAPDGLDGDTTVQKLRSSLRRAKQLLETGEILQADVPTTRPTPLNAPLRAATGRAGGVGRL